MDDFKERNYPLSGFGAILIFPALISSLKRHKTAKLYKQFAIKHPLALEALYTSFTQQLSNKNPQTELASPTSFFFPPGFDKIG